MSIMGPEEDDKIEANRLPYGVVGEIVAWLRDDIAPRYGAHAGAFTALADEISRLFRGGENGWRPIESAPKDGTRILALYGEDNRVDVVTWFDATSRPFWRSIATATVRGERYMRKFQPLYWRALLDGRAWREFIAAMRAYLRQWIDADVWAGAMVGTLRDGIDGLTSREAIAAWIDAAENAGIDPL